MLRIFTIWIQQHEMVICTEHRTVVYKMCHFVQP